jgi:hypothetical protein
MFLGIILAGIFLSCVEEPVYQSRQYPLLITLEASNVSSSGADLRGDILDLGGKIDKVEDHGFIYSTLDEPNFDNSEQISFGKINKRGEFSFRATRALKKDVAYFFRTYAKVPESELVILGNIKSFASLGGELPSITDFSPKSGNIGDTVTIIGTGFSEVKANNRVLFGEMTATVISSTKNEIKCIVPTSTLEGENRVQVIFINEVLNFDEKFVLKKITLNPITKLNYYFGDTVLVTGSNFPTNPTLINVILFQGSSKPFHTTSDSIRFIIPQDARNISSVLTILVGNQLINSTEILTINPPVINSFSPSRGNAGTRVVIEGKSFHPTIGRNQLRLNNITIPVISASANRLEVEIPNGFSSGSFPFVLNIFTQSTTSSDQFEIIVPE